MHVQPEHGDGCSVQCSCTEELVEISPLYQIDFQSDPLSNNMRFLMKQSSLGINLRLKLGFTALWREREGRAGNSRI